MFNRISEKAAEIKNNPSIKFACIINEDEMLNLDLSEINELKLSGKTVRRFIDSYSDLDIVNSL